MIVLPEGCQRGVSSSNMWGETIILGQASRSYSHSQHADISLVGSFCPLLSGLYSITFSGTFESQYLHYFNFGDRATQNFPATIEQNIQKHQCFPFRIYSAARYYATATIQVSLNGYSYIPSYLELLTCSYTGTLKYRNVGSPKQCSHIFMEISLAFFFSE